jgi:hypothetical protein
MSIVYCLVGYDKQTDELVSRIQLSPEDVQAVKTIARIPADDQTPAGDWPLDESQVSDIAGLLGLPVSQAWDFFLEPYVFS